MRAHPQAAPAPFALTNPAYRARASLAIAAVCAVYPIDRDSLARAGDTPLAREARAVSAVLLTEDVGLDAADAAEALGVTPRVLAASAAWLGSYLATEPRSRTEALRRREMRANIERARAAYERAERAARRAAVQALARRRESERPRAPTPGDTAP